MTIGKNLRDLLGPSQFSSEGFLGADERAPEDIIRDDCAALQKLGLTKEAVASALRDIYVKAERALGSPVALSSTLTAVHEEARGRTVSPFPGDGSFQKGQVKVTDASGGAALLLTPLSIHLIEKHGFFQGKGARYRIEPKEAAILIKKLTLTNPSDAIPPR